METCKNCHTVIVQPASATADERRMLRLVSFIIFFAQHSLGTHSSTTYATTAVYYCCRPGSELYVLHCIVLMQAAKATG
jgi:hypothetical protein